MEAVWRSVAFLLGHWPGALGAMVAFFLGVASARYVVRSEVRLLMALPVWLVRKVGRYLLSGPAVWQVFALIFLFNGTAIFVYLTLGLIPHAPAAIIFLTGMNIALAGIKGEEIMRELRPEPQTTGDAEGPPAVPLTPLAVFCTLLVLALELPCFWFTMAMAYAMDYGVGTVADPANLPDFRRRLAAYALVVLPLLAVSALAEAYAVTRPFRPARVPENPEHADP